MNRRQFGSWGLDLSGDDFAQALAAAGTFTAAAQVQPPEPGQTIADFIGRGLDAHDPSKDLVPWLFPHVDAFQLAPATVFRDAWQQSRLPENVRLEVIHWPGPSPLWIVEQLSRPAVKARSVYVRVDEPSVDVGWQWPLSLGLLNDERSENFRLRLSTFIEQSYWLPKLVSIVDVSEPPRVCDLLILPQDLREALRIVSSERARIRADCTLVIGRAPADDARSMSLLAGLRGIVATSAIALTHIPGQRKPGDYDLQIDWLEAFLRELSHNATIDVALAEASRDVTRFSASSAPLSLPFLVASRKLVDFSRLATQVRRMAERFKAMARAEPAASVLIESGSAFDQTFGKSGEQDMAAVGETLEKESYADAYAHETSIASVVAELAPQAEEIPARRRAARFLQARAFEVTPEDTKVERKRALRPTTPHQLRLRIAAPDREWASAPREFPMEMLPPDQPQYELTVVLYDTSYENEPQVAPIELPSSGPSTEAEFYVQSGREGTTMEWRVAVAYGNRILQTALFRAPVAQHDSSDSGIVLDEEAIVRPTFEDLAQRTRFDAALVLNHSPAGMAGGVALDGNKARSFQVSSDMKTVMKWIDDKLTEVANQPSLYDQGWKSDEAVTLLQLFAQQGAFLYSHIVKEGIGEEGLARGERLHVVSTRPEARLPLEFVYDRIAPAADAKICLAAIDALEEAAANPDKPLKRTCAHAPNDASVICPLSFWGVQKVIERHRYDRDLRLQVRPGDDFQLRSEPARNRNALQMLRAAVAGANYRVEDAVPDGMKDVCATLTEATTVETSPVPTWDKWIEGVRSAQPSLLVAIVHNEPIDNPPSSKMEIGRDSWVDVSGFTESYLRAQAGGDPVLLLLACESGAPTVDFNGFVAKARDLGAAIVVVAGAKIHAKHAVKAACALIGELNKAAKAAEASRAELTFGDAFRTVRRSLLASGLLMVLTLEAYGDADWRLATKH